MYLKFSGDKKHLHDISTYPLIIHLEDHFLVHLCSTILLTISISERFENLYKHYIVYMRKHCKQEMQRVLSIT